MAKKALVWTTLWNEYPDYVSYTSPQVKKDIGGAVDAAWITNTCAVRLSRTLNYNGYPLPQTHKGMLTVGGADKKRYAVRVRELEPWLRSVLGAPQHEFEKKENDPFDRAVLAAKKGILGFDIRFSDATGHLDLWDGSRFSSEHMMSKDYWVAATRIWLWEAL
jgi:hypothetical protein